MGQNMKILVLNDSTEEILLALKPWIGNTVTCVSNFASFLEALASQSWDVVSLDDVLGENDTIEKLSGGQSQATGLDAMTAVFHRRKGGFPKVVVHSKSLFSWDVMRTHAGKMGLEIEHNPIG